MELLYRSKDGNCSRWEFDPAILKKSNLITIIQTEDDQIIATYLNRPYIQDPYGLIHLDGYLYDVYDCNAMLLSVSKRKTYRVK
jgi:hypothetical protein